jgi:uncharacterized protein
MSLEWDGKNFEWDEVKNAINRSKHGVDFKDAVHVFFDPEHAEREDNHDYGEQRFQIIGKVSFGILFVVYTERSGDTIRLISARKATKAERRLYETGMFF